MPQSSTAGMLPIAIGRTRPATQDKAVRQAQRPHSSSAVPSELDKRLAEADAMLKVKMPVSPKPPFLANDKGLHQPAPPGAIYILSQPTHSPVDPLPLYYGGQTSPRGPPSPRMSRLLTSLLVRSRPIKELDRSLELNLPLTLIPRRNEVRRGPDQQDAGVLLRRTLLVYLLICLVYSCSVKTRSITAVR